MTGSTASSSAAASTADLLIHAEEAIGVSAFESTLHRWRMRLSPVARSSTRLSLHLRIDDLQGQRLAVVPDAGSLTRLSLPPGTCIVTATSGDIRRAYTLTLEPGKSFHLHLNHGQEWP